MSSSLNIVNVFNVILFAGVIYGLIFSLTLFFLKKNVEKPILFLNLQVLFITLNNLQAWLIDMQLVSSIDYIKYLKVPWYFLCMPMFYVFFSYYLRIQIMAKHVLRISLAIFTLFIALRLLLVKYAKVTNLEDLELENMMNRYSSIEEVIGFLTTLILLIIVIAILHRRQKTFQFVLNYDDLRWLKDFINLTGIILLFWVIAISINFKDGNLSSPFVYYPLRLSTTVLIYWIGFKGLFRFRILEDRIVLRENLRSGIKLGEHGIVFREDQGPVIDNKSEKQQTHFEKINEYVISQKLFLDPHLSLDSMANRLELSGGYISSLINNYSDYNFSDYINEFRVEQAKKLIKDDRYNHYTIVSIGLESGFNSKSAFYAAFKKFTNLSPKQYKN